MRAVVVLPTPRTPERIQACGMRPVSNAFETVRTIASWPIRSSNVAGRYLRASTRDEPSRAPSPGSDPIVPLLIMLSVSTARAGLNHQSQEFRREADERPEPRSLGLLPSGPDPVGEWAGHRPPPNRI